MFTHSWTKQRQTTIETETETDAEKTRPRKDDEAYLHFLTLIYTCVAELVSVICVRINEF